VIGRGGSDLRDRERVAALLALMQLLHGVACGASALERASAIYRRDHDCPSLEAIAKDVKGLPLVRVKALLGPPEYEPTPGQHYYSSNRSDCSLVLDYRYGDELTESVQAVDVGAIGE
jgi:hypothetical protein